MKRLPRIGVVLSSAVDGAEWASALRRALPADASGALLAPQPPATLTPCGAAELERASDVLVGVPCESPEVARALLDAGALAALVCVGLPSDPCLWQRGSTRGVDPGPGSLSAAAELARGVLERLGRLRPRFGLLASDCSDADALRALRSAGLDCTDALDPYAAAEARVDAWLCASTPTLHTVLAFAGSGARFALALDALALWVEQPTALGAALSTITPLLPAPTEAPRVQVHARQAPVEDRCPFCHRPTESDAVDGLAGPPVTCASCNAPHHRDCLAEHGGCAVMGCNSGLGKRWGVEVPLANLRPERAQRVAFEVRPGGGEGPLWVRVEEPIDDPRTTPGARRVRLWLPDRAQRGAWIHGYVAVESPRDFPIGGGVLELETTLRTRSDNKRQSRPIVAQRAAIIGSGVSSALGRLSQSLFKSKGRIVIPPGVRRYPVALRIPAAHPPTVTNRFKDVEESVQTLFRVQVGPEHAEQLVEVY